MRRTITFLLGILVAAMGWPQTAKADVINDSRSVPAGTNVSVSLFGSGHMEVLFPELTVPGVLNATYGRLTPTESQDRFGVDSSTLDIYVPGQTRSQVWDISLSAEQASFAGGARLAMYSTVADLPPDPAGLRKPGVRDQVSGRGKSLDGPDVRRDRHRRHHVDAPHLIHPLGLGPRVVHGLHGL